MFLAGSGAIRSSSDTDTDHQDGQELAWKARYAQELQKYERYLRRELLRSVRQRLEIAASQISGPLDKAPPTQLVEIVHDSLSQVFQQYHGVDPSSDESAALAFAEAPPAIPSDVFLPNTATLQDRDAVMARTGLDFSDSYSLLPVEEGYVDPSNMEMYLSLFSPRIDGDRHLVSGPGYQGNSFEIQNAPVSEGILGWSGGTRL